MRRDVPWLPIVIVIAMTMPLSSNAADQPVGAKRYRVVSPKAIDIIATAINGRGEIVGFEWAEEKARPGVLEQRPFLARGKEMTYLPLLKGYTATFPAALSDDGRVVGRSSKPAPPGVRVPLRNQAFLWDEASGIRGLGTLEGDSSSFACGISRDGRRISGYSVGDDRVRACVWDRWAVDGREVWEATALPQASQLGSQVVAISGDGRLVAAVDGVDPCLWRRSDDGASARELIAPGDPWLPRAVNDKGTVVGLRNTREGRTHAVVWARETGTITIEEPEGYERSEAAAVNDLGAVVGMVDGPRGSKVGPDAFVYEGGRLRLLTEGGPNFAAATAINDRGEVAGVLEEKED